mgnify:CR=1 FL=1
MNSLILTIICIAIIIVFFSSKDKFISSKKRYEKELLTKCMGDKAAVERLINHEVKRNPNLSREAAAETASYRITRDNS